MIIMNIIYLNLKVAMHGNNLQEIYNNIPMRLLPAEYCPEGAKNVSAGPLQQIIGNKC